MRIIDADALLAQQFKNDISYNAFRSLVKRQATIDAVPVKHGEWIDDGGLYRCSSCNHLWSELWWTENCPIERMLKIMPFCPNCGARMAEEGET